MTYIFIDTNIFLHFDNFEKIDWLKESRSDSCKLIIPPVVIDELDVKKIGTSKIGNRARKILNRFEELNENIGGIIKKNVGFEILLSKPNRSVYELNNLNFDEKDHRLIASIIQFRQERNINEILICTNDVGPRMRAKMFGIGSLRLDSKYLLPSTISEEEKQIKILVQENQQLKSGIPKLKVFFENEVEFKKIKIQHEDFSHFEEFKKDKIKKLKIEHPLMESVNQYDNPLAELAAIKPRQIFLYNNKLEEFYLEYENALDKIFEFEMKELCSFQIQLIIKNTGRAPAKDIDLHLHFPDGFELIESSEKEEYPYLPKPPYKPTSALDFGHSTFSSVLPISNQIFPNANLNFNPPSIKKTNSYDVDFSRNTLKHGYSEKLEELTIIFSNKSEIKSFQIDYEISAGNMPEKTIGKLNLSFVE